MEESATFVRAQSPAPALELVERTLKAFSNALPPSTFLLSLSLLSPSFFLRFSPRSTAVSFTLSMLLSSLCPSKASPTSAASTQSSNFSSPRRASDLR